MRFSTSEARAWRSDVTPASGATRSPSQASRPRRSERARARTAAPPPAGTGVRGGEASGSRGLCAQLAWGGLGEAGMPARGGVLSPPATSATPLYMIPESARGRPGSRAAGRRTPSSAPAAGGPIPPARRPAAPALPRQPTPRSGSAMTHLRHGPAPARSGRTRPLAPATAAPGVPEQHHACQALSLDAPRADGGGVKAHESTSGSTPRPSLCASGAHGSGRCRCSALPKVPRHVAGRDPRTRSMSTMRPRTRLKKSDVLPPRPGVFSDDHCTGALPAQRSMCGGRRRPALPSPSRAPGPGRAHRAPAPRDRERARPHRAARVRAGRGGPATPGRLPPVAQIVAVHGLVRKGSPAALCRRRCGAGGQGRRAAKVHAEGPTPGREDDPVGTFRPPRRRGKKRRGTARLGGARGGASPCRDEPHAPALLAPANLGPAPGE